MPEPPDLQRLVGQYGGYDKIPPRAWDLYEKQLTATQEWLAAHHKTAKGRK
jgi:hypothetical protein